MITPATALSARRGYQLTEVIVEATDEILLADIAYNARAYLPVRQFYQFRVNRFVHFTRRSETYLHRLEGYLLFPRTTTNAQNLYCFRISIIGDFPSQGLPF